MTETTEAALTEAALTDDEVAALAQSRGRCWRAVLPTIDPDDADDVGRAVWRGERSLIARGLLAVTPEATGVLDPGVDRLATTGLDGEVQVSAFTGSRDLTFDPTGFTYLNYRGVADEVLVEIVTSIGLHRFGLLSSAEAGRILLELVTGVHTGDGTSIGDVDDTFCLALPGADSDHRRVFAIRPGVVETAVIAPADLHRVDRASVPLTDSTIEELQAAIRAAYAG